MIKYWILWIDTWNFIVFRLSKWNTYNAIFSLVFGGKTFCVWTVHPEPLYGSVYTSTCTAMNKILVQNDHWINCNLNLHKITEVIITYTSDWSPTFEAVRSVLSPAANVTRFIVPWGWDYSPSCKGTGFLVNATNSFLVFTWAPVISNVGFSIA